MIHKNLSYNAHNANKICITFRIAFTNRKVCSAKTIYDVNFLALVVVITSTKHLRNIMETNVTDELLWILFIKKKIIMNMTLQMWFLFGVYNIEISLFIRLTNYSIVHIYVCDSWLQHMRVHLWLLEQHFNFVKFGINKFFVGI